MRIENLLHLLKRMPYEQARAQRIAELQARLAPLERQAAEL